MKKARLRKPLSEAATQGSYLTATTYFPIPTHQIKTTKELDSDSGTSNSKTRKGEAAKLDSQSGEFYGLLAELFSQTKTNPIVAIHAMSLFTQSLMRAERARLGIPNPESEGKDD